MPDLQKNNHVKVFRDPIHGLITFDKKKDLLLLKLINSYPFQRLRRIRQLGVSFFTYPSAVHDRFIHSIGVAHLIGKIIDNLNLPEKIVIHDENGNKILTPEQFKLLLKSTALLHDIGHGPFSHAFESITNVNHENLSKKIIEDVEISNILNSTQEEITDEQTGNKEPLSKYLNKWIKEILEGILKPAWVRELISGQFDADRLDYLIRDAYMCGVQYANLDVEWILHNIEIIHQVELNNPKIKEDILVINASKGIYSMEAFIIARYHMFEQVYYHKTTRCFEKIIEHIFKRLDQLKIEENEQFNRLKYLDNQLKYFIDNPENIEAFLSLDDFYIISQIRLWSEKCEDEILKELCQCFIHRRPFFMFKEVDEEGVDLFSRDDYNIIDGLFLDKKQTDYYFIVDNAPTKPYAVDYLKGKGNIFLINSTDGKISELSEKSTLIGALRNKLKLKKRAFIKKEIYETNSNTINKISNLKSKQL